MVTYKLTGKRELTVKEKEELSKAKDMPIIYDEDSPELTEKMIEAFQAARKAKPFKKSTAI